MIGATMADATQGKPPMEEFCNGVSQSRVVLAKPRLGGFGTSTASPGPSKVCNTFSSVLRPSQLKPGSNPFLKVNESKDKETDIVKEKETDSTTEEQLDKPKEDAEAPKFVPLGSNVVPKSANPVPAPAQPTTSSSSSGFVFGQNLSERVVIQENVNNGEAVLSDHSSTNGTSELLFTAAASATTKDIQEEAGPSEAGSAGAGLAAAAAEYERSHARPLPPRQTLTLTGEEDEINVLQISCRLFAWESGSWRERGRGVLRLNDAAEGGAARLVARVAGSLRVVLNTKLWPEMVVERAGTKSLRITATDAQHQVKLFLIMAAPADIAQLSRALTARIAVSKRMNNCDHNATSQQAAERLEAATDEDEFLKPDAGLDKQTADDKKDDAEVDDESLEEQKTDESQEEKQLKRKEPAEDETSPPKRQCPKIVVD